MDRLPSSAVTLKLKEILWSQVPAVEKGDEVQPVSSEYVLGLLPSSLEPQM